MSQPARHAGSTSLLSRLTRFGTTVLAAVLAAAASPAPASAALIDFTGDFTTFEVPATGTYTITAAGRRAVAAIPPAAAWEPSSAVTSP